jgi:hypothetical protein
MLDRPEHDRPFLGNQSEFSPRFQQLTPRNELQLKARAAGGADASPAFAFDRPMRWCRISHCESIVYFFSGSGAPPSAATFQLPSLSLRHTVKYVPL